MTLLKYAVFILLVTYAIQCDGLTTNTINFWCLRHSGASVKMMMEIYNSNPDTPIQSIVAINQDTDGTIASCADNNAMTGSGTAGDPYKLTIVVTDPQAGTATPECGHKISGTLVYTWVFRITTGSPVVIPGLSFGSSGNETLVCPFDPVINPVIADVPDASNVPNDLERLAIDAGVEEVLLTVANPVTNEKIIQAAFASEAILILQLLEQSKRKAEALTAVYCLACPTSACDQDTVPLVDINGCEADDNIFLASAVDGFTSRRDPLASVGAKTVYSNKFQMFKFSLGDFVYFRCSVDYCYDYIMSTGNPRCDNRCLWSQGKRRKRSASNRQSSTTVVRVISSSEQTPPANASQEGGERSCINDPVILVTIPTIAAIAVITSVAAFSMCLVLHMAHTSASHRK